MSNGTVNKVILIGRLGQNPDLRYTQGGSAVCSLSLATSEKFKDGSGEYKEQTDWHRCVVWGKLGESAGKYLRKGSRVYIEGRNHTRTWTDKDGQKRYATEVVAQSLTFLDSTKDQQEADHGENDEWSGADGSPSSAGAFDDIPF